MNSIPNPPVALVTGGPRRVGRAIALELARAGCDVAVHYHTSDDDARRTADDIRALGRRATLLKADLEDSAAAGSLPGRCAADLGRLDIVVNNAASFDEMSLESFDLARWNRTLAVNLTAPAVVAHHAAPLIQAGGAIVNICDILAERPARNYIAYCAAKAGLVSLTHSLARTLAPRIRVNGVSPGIAAWPEHFTEDQKKALIARVPAQRAGTPDEVAAAVRFLAIDAVYVTGVVLAVDGGRAVAW